MKDMIEKLQLNFMHKTVVKVSFNGTVWDWINKVKILSDL